MPESKSSALSPSECGVFQNNTAVYYLKRSKKQGATTDTRCIVAYDDGEAIELAYIMCGPNRAQIWQAARLVHEIQAFVFKHAPGSG